MLAQIVEEVKGKAGTVQARLGRLLSGGFTRVAGSSRERLLFAGSATKMGCANGTGDASGETDTRNWNDESIVHFVGSLDE
jgi:hypothetical protein